MSKRPRRSKNGTPEERAAKAAAGIKEPAEITKPMQVEKPDEAPLVFKTYDNREFILRLHDLLLAPEAVRLRFVEDLRRRWPKEALETKKPGLSVVPDEPA